MKHRTLLLTAATVAVIGGTLLGSTNVFAQSATTDGGPMSPLVQKIADKFGLNKDEVQAVFDESRAEMETQRKAEYETRLTQLVTDGKITEAQKQLIIAKNAELEAGRKAAMDSMKSATDAERKDAMDAMRTSLESWAEDNDIDLQYLMMGHGGPGGHGPGMRGE